ncbi:MAG: aminopeptidase [Bacillota bacterium]|nr:aminopeptidase [Bacillota bacterium]
MKESSLKEYARLIAVTGANVQKDQEVVLHAEPDQPEFVFLLTEECYKAGASRVRVEWGFQPLMELHTRYQTLETLSQLADWEVEKLRSTARLLPAVIYLDSADPDGLANADAEKMVRARQAKYPIEKPFLDAMENRHQWCVAAVPGQAWAEKVFPALKGEEAVEKLWEAILQASRAEKDPAEAWRAHNEDLAGRCRYLNSLGLASLEYRAGNGTRLKVGLIPDALFLGGRETTIDGCPFNPNIPSEEIFISPMRGEAEGVVCATKPLSYRGQLIEDFHFRFQDGKVAELGAGKNQELLRRLVAMDEGAPFLGECALIPQNSPINRSGLLFYNTLFDENASCHLALGAGFTNCIRGYQELSLEECRRRGINDSMIHQDFMIGTEDLSVTGRTRDGRQVPIFRDGGWAF